MIKVHCDTRLVSIATWNQRQAHENSEPEEVETAKRRVSSYLRRQDRRAFPGCFPSRPTDSFSICDQKAADESSPKGIYEIEQILSDTVHAGTAERADGSWRVFRASRSLVVLRWVCQVSRSGNPRLMVIRVSGLGASRVQQRRTFQNGGRPEFGVFVLWIRSGDIPSFVPGCRIRVCGALLAEVLALPDCLRHGTDWPQRIAKSNRESRKIVVRDHRGGLADAVGCSVLSEAAVDLLRAS